MTKNLTKIGLHPISKELPFYARSQFFSPPWQAGLLPAGGGDKTEVKTIAVIPHEGRQAKYF